MELELRFQFTRDSAVPTYAEIIGDSQTFRFEGPTEPIILDLTLELTLNGGFQQVRTEETGITLIDREGRTYTYKGSELVETFVN